MDKMKLSVEIKASALRTLGDMLRDMADGLDGNIDRLVVVAPAEELSVVVPLDAAVTPKGNADPSVLNPPGTSGTVTAPSSADVFSPTAREPVQEEATGPELDSAGFPWNTIIHGSGKTKYANAGGPSKPKGGWKLKKGIDLALVAQIEGEMVAQGFGHTDATPVSQPDATPVSQPDATPVSQPNVMSPFVELANKVAAGLGNGTLQPATLMQILNGMGLSGIGDVSSRAELIPAINAALFSD